jgi:hypothetical protein
MVEAAAGGIITHIAREYTHEQTPAGVAKYLEIVERCCDHRPWFNDYVWDNPGLRRIAVRDYLADAVANGKLWEVYKAKADSISLAGIMLLNRLSFKMDAYCHFLFFDHDLGGKRSLCLDAMDWCFSSLGLEVLRMEVPTYASSLGLWARRKLGFRYDAETTLAWWLRGKKPTRRFLEAASSRRKVILHKNKWCNVISLSVTREEFSNHVRSLRQPLRSQSSSVSRTDARNGEPATGVATEPTSDPPAVPTS